MISKLFGGAAALLMLSAVQAQAQTSTHKGAAAVTAPSGTVINYGPPLTGVCVFSNEGALGASAVGKAAATRLQQLRAQASAELSGEQTSLQEDIKAFQAKRASLTQDQIQAQGAPLEERAQALNQKATQRQHELEYTAQHARVRIEQAVEPLVRTVFEERHCSLLLSGEAVMAANPAMDITSAVVTRLNATMSTITFDRETPPAQQ
jgi:Skp family chaperone for outer membrane proteins